MINIQAVPPAVVHYVLPSVLSLLLLGRHMIGLTGASSDLQNVCLLSMCYKYISHLHPLGQRAISMRMHICLHYWYPGCT